MFYVNHKSLYLFIIDQIAPPSCCFSSSIWANQTEIW